MSTSHLVVLVATLTVCVCVYDLAYLSVVFSIYFQRSKGLQSPCVVKSTVFWEQEIEYLELHKQLIREAFKTPIW